MIAKLEGKLEENESPQQASEPPQPTFLSQHGQKLVALSIWLVLLGGYAWYYLSNNLTPALALAEIVELLASPLGPVLYILIYALRPLVFFSAAALTIASGAVFGAGSVWNLALAVIYTVIASNTSATVAYLVGRYFGQGLLTEGEGDKRGLIQRYAGRMRHNSFETIMIMRFIFLPYDLVNYLAGFLRIDWKQFILATFVGSVPGTIAFVSFGASISITDLLAGKTPEFNPWVLAFGALIFGLSLAISRYFKRREAGQSESAG
ncbi:MAG TPA: TVP38/TMEM64 family protein [Anaerolineae bacterium]|nr:TVP38/TMEM64 family protein [Anaerolineae bacterium]